MTVASGGGAAPGAYLAPTRFLDATSPVVSAFAKRAIGRDRPGGDSGAATDRTADAVALYYAVRDGIRYDPYSIPVDPAQYVASRVAELPSGFCVQKAILMAAASRSLGIPARLGFADVRNHLASDKLLERMGTDLFVFHGYVELFLDGRWVKATPAFNRQLCERFGVKPLEFDGHRDSIFHPFDAEGRRHMEYVRDRGTFAEFPFEEMARAFRATYPNLVGGRTAPAPRDVLFDPAA